jgi:RimJ/RimL family protein N-acetyltransferase
MPLLQEKLYRETFTGKDASIFEIRTIKPDEAAPFSHFLELIAQETPFTNEFTGQPKDVEKMRAGLRKLPGNPSIFWVGAFNCNELVGFLGSRAISSGNHPFFNHIYTFDLMILKKAWGKGLGSRLMQILDEQANGRGIKRIEAVVKQGNDRAMALYKKHGYQVEGTRRKSVRVGNGFIDEYYVAKLF